MLEAINDVTSASLAGGGVPSLPNGNCGANEFIVDKKASPLALFLVPAPTLGADAAASAEARAASFLAALAACCCARSADKSIIVLVTG
jgi:hypothetical protein